VTLDAAVAEILLALADDELFMGHRHSEWLGVAPFLEEDLAHASIAQDELGHARALYGLLTDDVDALTFERGPDEYRSAWLVELPCRDWEEALARHFFYDLAEQVRWQSVRSAGVPGATDVAAKALREEEYHVAHAVPLIARLLAGTTESRSRVEGALSLLYPYALGLFEPTSGEDQAVSEAGLTAAADLETQWVALVRTHLEGSGVTLMWDGPALGRGGRAGVRSEHFAEMHANMTAVYAIDPAASW
jgi:ring-1,2-phenylacetyl-CoA epoxidase subunit PaaC